MNPLFTPSVEYLPIAKANAVFTSDSGAVFREDRDIMPVPINDSHSFMPWGGDNHMPYDIMDLFEKDETLATCGLFNAEVCYGAGIEYVGDDGNQEIEDFLMHNSISTHFFGACQDIKTFAFAVSVVILSKDMRKIVSIARREACYCRFSPMKQGRIGYVYYANWRNAVSENDVEIIPLLDPDAPLPDLKARVAAGEKCGKYAILTKVPTVDSTYYPLPYYAALLRGKWYNIKQLIAVAKEAKLRNSAPIKYHIEISENYWNRLIRAEKITDPTKIQERIVEEKQNIMDFLTTAENSGKVWFSQFYVSPDGKEQHDVRITKIDDSKEGGDWATDIQEAVNMICFTMRVHSNLVGSVPGKSQSNNSGSDKRELYTISQAIQKPYRDMLLRVHKIVCAFNGWKRVKPTCSIIQLTTLDKHTDAKTTEQ